MFLQCTHSHGPLPQEKLRYSTYICIYIERELWGGVHRLDNNDKCADGETRQAQRHDRILCDRNPAQRRQEHVRIRRHNFTTTSRTQWRIRAVLSNRWIGPTITTPGLTHILSITTTFSLSHTHLHIHIHTHTCIFTHTHTYSSWVFTRIETPSHKCSFTDTHAKTRISLSRKYWAELHTYPNTLNPNRWLWRYKLKEISFSSSSKVLTFACREAVIAEAYQWKWIQKTSTVWNNIEAHSQHPSSAHKYMCTHTPLNMGTHLLLTHNAWPITNHWEYGEKRGESQWKTTNLIGGTGGHGCHHQRENGHHKRKNETDSNGDEWGEWGHTEKASACDQDIVSWKIGGVMRKKLSSHPH